MPEEQLFLDEQILSLLEDCDMTRSELVELTGAPRTTVYNYLERLIIQKKVIKIIEHNYRKKGRPNVLFQKVN